MINFWKSVCLSHFCFQFYIFRFEANMNLNKDNIFQYCTFSVDFFFTLLNHLLGLPFLFHLFDVFQCMTLLSVQTGFKAFLYALLFPLVKPILIIIMVFYFLWMCNFVIMIIISFS